MNIKIFIIVERHKTSKESKCWVKKEKLRCLKAGPLFFFCSWQETKETLFKPLLRLCGRKSNKTKSERQRWFTNLSWHQSWNKAELLEIGWFEGRAVTHMAHLTGSQSGLTQPSMKIFTMRWQKCANCKYEFVDQLAGLLYRAEMNLLRGHN